jgi:hypothetical protein
MSEILSGDNPFFIALVAGVLVFSIGVLWTAHSLEKDHKKKPHKHKKA